MEFGSSGSPCGGLRLLLEALDHIRMIGIDFDHAELVGLADGLTDAGNGEFRAGFDVLLHHLLEIHTIDMVGAPTITTMSGCTSSMMLMVW